MNETQTIPDAIVEKAAKALYDSERSNPDWDADADNYRTKYYRNPTRAALEAVYADIQAEALREAADELASYDHTDRQSGYLLAGRHIMARLRARADRLAGA